MLNNVSDKEAKSRTIKILIKLFVIKMVANSFLGFSSKETTILSSLALLESSSKSFWDNEKKATSVPETKAELISNAIKAKPLNVDSKSMDAKNKNSGSGSKCNSFG